MIPQSNAPSRQAAPRMSRLAIASLVLGCCMVLCSILAGVPALALGIAALVAINRSRGQLFGQGLAIAGICLGGVSLLVFPIVLAFLFPVISSVRNQANKAKAAASISSLCVASRAYNNEYGKWPELRSAEDLVLIFNGCRNPVTGELVERVMSENPRKTQFMEFKANEVTRPGSGGTSALAFCDPWGVPYAFCFDNGKAGYVEGGVWKDSVAYDNQVDMPFRDGPPGSSIHAGCAFFSSGPDGRTGTASTTRDDIRSWK